MGSSNKGVVTRGDVEDQWYNPKWFVNHKHMLRPNQEDEVNKLGFDIFKVPECWRQPSKDFSPIGWYFGLHNRENIENNGSEIAKLGIAVQYGLVGEKWVQFCDEIVDDPKAMLVCYGLQHGGTNWTDEQIKHVLALDALYLATYIDLDFPENERRLWTPKALPSWSDSNTINHRNYGFVHSALNLVENQIPFVLIDKVVKYFSNFVASQTSEINEPIVDDLQYQQKSLEILVSSILPNCFIDISTEAFEKDRELIFSGEKTHILGAVYKVICGCEGLRIKQSSLENPDIRIPSATKLEESGIIFVGVNGPLCKMSYKEKHLYLPKVKICPDTMSLIRNMVWYESQSILDGCLFNDYYILMTDLIQAPKDLDLLIERGIIYNDNACSVFEDWTTSLEAVIGLSSSQIHYEMKEAIVRRCKHKRYRLWSEFNTIFCSKPWLVLSTIAVVLVTVATLVQTYVSIIGSNKMKPNYP